MPQDLPVLVLDVICSHLSYEDVLALRSTCKSLKEFVDGKPFTKLNLFIRNYSYNRRLFYTGEPVGYQHSFHSGNLAILTTAKFREKFANLRRMTICSMEIWGVKQNDKITEFGLNRLNCFRALRHLEVDAFSRLQGELNLPELRIAFFQVHRKFNELNSPFSLDCPRLRALRLTDWLRPVLSSATDQLDYLHLGNYGQGAYLKSISSNLRKLSTICVPEIRDLLKLFVDLKTRGLNLPALGHIRLEHQYRSIRDLRELENLAPALEDLKENTIMKQIEFTFLGRLIDSSDELRLMASLVKDHDSKADEKNELNLRILRKDHLHFLKQNPGLDFLLSAAAGVNLEEEIDLSGEMIKKLEGIHHLNFSHRYKPNSSTFKMFARDCKSLRCLSLLHQTVTERLLAMMSNHLVNLQCIAIHECEYETLKPLAKFRNLEFICLDFDPKEELNFIYKNSRSLENVSFFGQKIVELLRTTTTPRLYRIYMTKHDKEFEEFNTLDAMLSYYHVKGLFIKRKYKEASIRLGQVKNN